MTISPVTPKDKEQMVPTTTAIIFDATESINTVQVNDGLIWSGGSPQNGWLGYTISHPAGTRFVFDPPSIFSVGNLVTVVVSGASTTLTYQFVVGLRQITFTDDASVPRIAEGGPANTNPATPAWFLPLDDASGPPVDVQGNYVFTQTGAPTWQQTGIIPPALKAVRLNGAGDALATATTGVLQSIWERTVTINNVTGTTTADASVAVVVDTAALIAASKMAGDGGCEFRTTDGTLLPYWLDGAANNVTTTYWVKIASLPAGVTTIKMRFSASEAFPTFNDKFNAFLFFDDFSSDTIDPSRWTVTGTGFSIVGGKLRGGIANAGANYMRSVTTFPVTRPAKVVARVNETVPIVNGFTTIGFFNSTSDGTSILAHDNTSYYYVNGGFTNFAFDGSGVGDVVDEVWMTGASVRFKRDKTGQSYDSGFVAAALNGETLFLGARGDFYAGGPQAYTCDWSAIFARTYMATEPTVTFSSDVAIGTGTILAIPIPDPIKPQKFSLSGWFNPSSVSAQRALASVGRGSDRGWILRILATNVIEFRAFNGVTGTSATGTTIAGIGAWQHVAVVVDMVAGALRLYVNSNKEAEVTPGFATIVYEALVNFFLGRDPVAAPDDFQGRLDQWKFYSGVALTDGQVSQLFQESTGPLRTPWVGYSREPGNIYVRKDEPLTAEVLLVPGDKVDIGYSETTNEIEIVYIQNGKVFIVTGQASENPSTLVQPSILKTNIKSGVTGESPNHRHDVVTFTPIKLAVPTDGPLVSGFTGESPFITFSSPPNSPAPVAFLGTPAAAIVPPVSSTLITSVRLFKINTGAAVQVAELPYSTEIQVFLDPAYAEGDRYYTQSVYGDQGASAMRRLTARSADAGATNGDFLRAGFTGESPQHTHSTVTFAPLKLAVPTDGPVVSGYTGHSGEAGFTRTWFPAVGTAAAMSSAVGGHVVFTGLVQMSRQHLDRQITVSGAATAANNGSWTIVDIISATSVRVAALTAPGSDANNGALVWSVTGADSVAPASFVARNTVNIGAGS